MSDPEIPGKMPPDAEWDPSDEAWFARLTGRASPASAPQAEAEADALALAIRGEQARAVAAAASDPPEEDPATRRRKFEALQFRLRREGLLDRQKTPATKWLLPLGLAASVLLTFFAMSPHTPDYPQPTEIRGALQVQIIQDPAPAARVRTLAEQLTAVGLPSRIAQDHQDYFVDVVVPPERLAELQDVLVRMGIKPGPGLLRIEVSK